MDISREGPTPPEEAPYADGEAPFRPSAGGTQAESSGAASSVEEEEEEPRGRRRAFMDLGRLPWCFRCREEVLTLPEELIDQTVGRVQRKVREFKSEASATGVAARRRTIGRTPVDLEATLNKPSRACITSDSRATLHDLLHTRWPAPACRTPAGSTQRGTRATSRVLTTPRAVASASPPRSRLRPLAMFASPRCRGAARRSSAWCPARSPARRSRYPRRWGSSSGFRSFDKMSPFAVCAFAIGRCP